MFRISNCLVSILFCFYFIVFIFILFYFVWARGPLPDLSPCLQAQWHQMTFRVQPNRSPKFEGQIIQQPGPKALRTRLFWRHNRPHAPLKDQHGLFLFPHVQPRITSFKLLHARLATPTCMKSCAWFLLPAVQSPGFTPCTPLFFREACSQLTEAHQPTVPAPRRTSPLPCCHLCMTEASQPCQLPSHHLAGPVHASHLTSVAPSTRPSQLLLLALTAEPTAHVPSALINLTFTQPFMKPTCRHLHGRGVRQHLAYKKKPRQTDKKKNPRRSPAETPPEPKSFPVIAQRAISVRPYPNPARPIVILFRA